MFMPHYLGSPLVKTKKCNNTSAAAQQDLLMPQKAMKHRKYKNSASVANIIIFTLCQAVIAAILRQPRPGNLNYARLHCMRCSAKKIATFHT
jgi:hypothetical protein